MDEQKTPIQPSSEQTKLNEASAQVVQSAGGQVHHEEDHTQQAEQQVAVHTNSPQPSVPHGQFEQPVQAPSPQASGTPQKKSLLDAILGIFSLRWFKSNMRNKYGEDVNRIRSVREAEKSAHAQKNPPQQYIPQRADQTSQASSQPNSQPSNSAQPPVSSLSSSTPPQSSQQTPEQELSRGQSQTQN